MQYYMHNFLASQPDLNFHNPAVQDAQLDNMRFWLERGIDGFRLDTVNFYFHSLGLESNPVVKPEDFNASTAPAVNPYNFQEHLYDKSQPENATFMERIRALLDEYGAKTSVGEIGDSQHQLEVMSQYTSGTNRLHMAYTFDYLGGEFSASHFRKAIDLTERDAPDGWICLAFSNHDVVRHISRWATHGQQEQFTRLACTMLLSMRGSVCLYQGEELGLTEAELAFEDLVDPYGIEFWPQFKGRDGCRTPMVWQTQSQQGGFTTATRAWLPVPADHMTKAVDRQVTDPTSVLSHYKAMLAFRKAHPALIRGTIKTLDAPDGVLAFLREGEGERLYCVFNMSEKPAAVTLPAGFHVTASDAPGIDYEPQEGALSLAPFGAYIGIVR
jgi:alpha-glucosidase